MQQRREAQLEALKTIRSIAMDVINDVQNSRFSESVLRQQITQAADAIRTQANQIQTLQTECRVLRRTLKAEANVTNRHPASDSFEL